VTNQRRQFLHGRLAARGCCEPVTRDCSRVRNLLQAVGSRRGRGSVAPEGRNRPGCKSYLCGVLLALLCAGAASADELHLARTLSGGDIQYTVRKGDSLAAMGSRFGVEPAVLARANGLDTGERLEPGSTLRVDNRHVVPDQLEDGIVIDMPQRMVFFVADGELAAAYPAAMGQRSWRTPQGDFTVVDMTVNPIWTVPVSIQRDMARQGKAVLTRVAAGPRNPLGKRWIGLSLGGIGIHGTTKPLSVYHFLSHGCVRLNADDVAALFVMVKPGTPGTIIYEPVLLAQLDDGRIFVEANPDISGQETDSLHDLHTLADSSDIGNMIDWPRVKDALERKDGLAREVTAHDMPAVVDSIRRASFITAPVRP
jgi:L,D-transpeptidase ErfK/SrfK